MSTPENADKQRRSRIVEEVWRTLDALARRDDFALSDIFERSRTKLSDMYRGMDEYGGDFGSPPASAYHAVDLAPMPLHPADCWADVCLWTVDGKPSDLSIILSIAVEGEAVLLAIDDVRVM